MRFFHLPLRLCAALFMSALIIVLPLFWLRFVLTAPDSISIDICCDDGTEVSIKQDVGGEYTSLEDLYRGEVDCVDGSGVSGKIGCHTFRYSPTGRIRPDCSTFRVKFDGGPPKRFFVRSIEFRRHDFFFSRLLGKVFLRCYDISNAKTLLKTGDAEILPLSSEVVFSPGSPLSLQWHFEPRFSSWTSHDKVSLLLIIGVAIAVSLLAVFPYFRQKERLFLTTNILQLSLVALCTSFFFGIVLPVSSYLANRNAFDFTALSLLAQQVPQVLLLFAACMVAFICAFPFLGWIPPLLLQGFLVYEYLETGLLSADFPSLAGSADFFTNTNRQIFDFAVLCGICGFFVLAWKWVRLRLHWISLALLVLMAASLADTRVADSDGGAAKRDPCVKPCIEVLNNAFFSPTKNILFFVLDAIDVKVADEVLVQNPEWMQSLTGFIAFTNNVGMYSHTSYGVPGILTGRYAPTLTMTAAYGASAIGTNAFFRQYADAGYPVFTLQSGLGVGWSNAANEPPVSADRMIGGGVSRDQGGDVMHERMDAQMAWNVEELCLFRAIPFFEKAKCLRRFQNVWDHGMALTPPEGFLFSLLRKAPIQPDAPCTLHFHHTKGGHIPFVRDRNGHVWNGADNLEGYFEQSCYALGETVRFIDDLKSRGLYDSALIVLLADHGLTYEHFRDVERNTHPFLWVKPPHAKTGFSRSGEPTSHSKVHLLARESLNRDLTSDEVIRLLGQPEGRVSYTLERRVHYDPHFYDAEGRPTTPPKP